MGDAGGVTEEGELATAAAEAERRDRQSRKARAGSCVAGSMTRSGRMTTQPVSTTKITRASAAMPGVVSVSPPHDVGDNELPMPRR